jgi:Arylsulfotransferase (ASST)
MKKIIFSLILIFVAASFFGCDNSKKEEEQSKKPDPNIGGLGMPRGLISKTDEATPGYVIFSPLLSDTTYLVDTDGKVVHTWASEYGPSGWLYLKENGNLVRGGRQPDAPVFGGGGQGGRIQEFSWDGELVWDYLFATENHLSHHDVSILPNGNILVLAWEIKTPEEAIKAGRKPEFIPKAGLWPDKVVEIKPVGKNEAEIVWEWHMWDHMIQNHDQTKDNYGIPTEHPELLDLNMGAYLPKPITQEQLNEQRANNNAVTNSTLDNRGSDLYHMNAIDYNAELDQIVLSSPALDEIFVIDHSTTPKEAASHAGGRWGKGGDYLYRWGNPENYGRGDSTDHKIGGQHDVKWIPKDFPGGGNLMVFNNNVPNSRKPHSAVYELTPPLTANGYELSTSGKFGPQEPSWKFVAADTLSAFAPFISGAHRMANGNTFVTVGPKGRYIEVTPEGKIVWDYWTPYAGYVRMKDGTTPQPVGPLSFATFRATHIPIDHPAVKDKVLKPLDPQPAVYKEAKK